MRDVGRWCELRGDFAQFNAGLDAFVPFLNEAGRALTASRTHSETRAHWHFVMSAALAVGVAVLAVGGGAYTPRSISDTV